MTIMFYLGVLFHVCFLLLESSVKGQHKVPEVLIEAFTPTGIRVSIPDQKDLSQFIFHGNVNKEIKEREPGILSKYLNESQNGRWTFTDESISLNIGDVIYYRARIDFLDGMETVTYRKRNRNFTITELTPSEGTTASSTTTTTTTTIPSLLPIITPPNTTVASTTTTTTVSSLLPIIKPPNTTVAPPCLDTITMVGGKKSCKGKLIFQETFTELSEKRWQAEVKFAQEPDYEFVVYQDHKDNLYIEKTLLHIRPTLVEERLGSEFVSQPAGLDLGESCTGIPDSMECVQKPKAWAILPPVFSAQISTKDRFSFLYGIVEIRARFPKGDWIYPQLFLRSRSDDYGEGYDSGLIKIAFSPGNANQSKVLSGGCILGESVFARNYGLKSLRSLKDWNSDFHVYRMEWDPEHITLSVDNQIYGNIYPPDDGFASKERELHLDQTTSKRWRKGTTFAPFDKEMYLIVGIGVGGSTFADRKDGSKPWTNDDPKGQRNFYKAQDVWRKTWANNTDMVLDYVRIWAL